MITFKPDCTRPEGSEGFVQGPDVRSTLDIVWACLSIIVLSTWTVLHLNVGPQVTPVTKTQFIRVQISSAMRKIKWMAVSLFAPEIVLGYAVNNLWTAWKNTPKLLALAKADNVPWSLTHTLLANMGGFALHFSHTACQQDPSAGVTGENGCEAGIPGSRTTAGGNRGTERAGAESHMVAWADALGAYRKLRAYGEHKWTPCELHSAHARKMLSRYTGEFYRDMAIRHQGHTWTVDSTQLIVCRELGIISCLPRVSEAEISDKSNSDAMVKVIAVVQVAWLWVQLVVRRVKGLPPTILELVTAAFSVVAFMLYTVQWPKPKDVQTMINIDADKQVKPKEFMTIVRHAPLVFFPRSKMYNIRSHSLHVVAGKDPDARIVTSCASAAGGAIFGALHLLGWNATLPTHVEMVLWKVALLTTVLVPLAVTIFFIMHAKLDKMGLGVDLSTGTTIALAILGLTVTLITGIYAVARLFILVEAFRSLYFLPPAAFISSWASNLPHIG